tara:strand:- start:800 stop:1066 length:267 start_codon:yes stop_codon:yes gene_type:complete
MENLSSFNVIIFLKELIFTPTGALIHFFVVCCIIYCILIAWSEGNHSLLEMAEKCNTAIRELNSLLTKLQTHDLLALEAERSETGNRE